MNFRKMSSEGLSQLEAQPRISLERLFNLMLRAQKHNLMWIILDECENEFNHRKLHKLTLKEQEKLYNIARDEIASYWHRNEIIEFSTPWETVQ